MTRTHDCFSHIKSDKDFLKESCHDFSVKGQSEKAYD